MPLPSKEQVIILTQSQDYHNLISTGRENVEPGTLKDLEVPKEKGRHAI